MLRLIKLPGLSLGVLLVMAILCRLFWLQPMRDTARCMVPTVNPGDLFIVNRLSYLIAEPQRGDIVLIDGTDLQPTQSRQHSRWIKRIVGIPGDVVSIHPPHVLIDGVPLAHPEVFATRHYALPDTTKWPNAVLKGPEDEAILADGEYFLLGDNTANSLDSRHLGPVSRSTILGRLLWTISPASRRRGLR